MRYFYDYDYYDIAVWHFANERPGMWFEWTNSAFLPHANMQTNVGNPPRHRICVRSCVLAAYPCIGILYPSRNVHSMLRIDCYVIESEYPHRWLLYIKLPPEKIKASSTINILQSRVSSYVVVVVVCNISTLLSEIYSCSTYVRTYIHVVCSAYIRRYVAKLMSFSRSTSTCVEYCVRVCTRGIQIEERDLHKHTHRHTNTCGSMRTPGGLTVASPGKQNWHRK